MLPSFITYIILSGPYFQSLRKQRFRPRRGKTSARMRELHHATVYYSALCSRALTASIVLTTYSVWILYVLQRFKARKILLIKVNLVFTYSSAAYQRTVRLCDKEVVLCISAWIERKQSLRLAGQGLSHSCLLSFDDIILVFLQLI